MARPTTPDEAQVMEQAQQFRTAYQALRQQIGQVIVGQAEIVDGVLTCLFAGGHCLLEGVPGLGKTLLIRSLAQALSLKFSRIQFTPDLMPADITGTTIVHEDASGGREFRFQPGPIFGQIILADEINRATPKTQSALLEAMQERSVTVAGATRLMDQPFFVMATQNPIEQEGTYPLPEAQLDRFFFKLLVGYVSRDELHAILDRTTTAAQPRLQPVLDGPAILQHQMLVRHVIVAPHVQDFAIRAVIATHPQGAPGSDLAGKTVKQFVRYGASPRAAQTVILGAKVRALLDGRAHVSTDDIRQVFLPALRHRIILNFEGQAEGLTPDLILQEVLETLPVEAAAAR